MWHVNGLYKIGGNWQEYHMWIFNVIPWDDSKIKYNEVPPLSSDLLAKG